MVGFNATIIKSITLKTYNQSNIEQPGRCLVKIRQINKCVKCTFLIVPGDDPALHGMLDIELLRTIRVICETIDNKTTGRKFESQTRHILDSQNCKTNSDPQAKPDTGSINKSKTHM